MAEEVTGEMVRAAEAAFMSAWSEQGFGSAPRDDNGCRVHPFYCINAALVAAASTREPT